MANQDPNQSNKKADGSPKGDNREAGDVDGNNGGTPGSGHQTGDQSAGDQGRGTQGDGAKRGGV